MIRFIVEAPRWLLLALLLFAPWAYGCTRPWSIAILIQAMPLLLVLWVIGCGLQRRWPVVHPVFLACAVLLFFQGWGMIANAQSVYNRETYQFILKTQPWKFAPGVVDQEESIPTMLRITGLLGIVAFASDLTQRERWRRRIAWTLGLSGGSLVLFGIVQRMLGAQSIFWEDNVPAENFFATYFYHANAAAFINLVLPIIAGLVFVSFRSPSASSQRSCWVPVLIITLAGAMAAASKGGIVVTALLCVAFLIWTGRPLWQAWRLIPSPAVKYLTLLALVFGIFAVGWFGWEKMMHRVTDTATVTESSHQRLLTYQVCLTMIPDAGAWGFGAGTFVLVFPLYTNSLGNKIEGIWRFAHDDYLQTLLEWGWIGAIIAGVVFLGGIILAIRTYRARKQQFSTADRTLLATICMALCGVAAHSLVDFPLQIASLQLYAATYLGMAWGSGRWKPTRGGSGAAS